jgi:hypothetical protein
MARSPVKWYEREGWRTAMGIAAAAILVSSLFGYWYYSAFVSGTFEGLLYRVVRR